MSLPVPAELTRAWLTADVPAIPGEARAAPEDFRVEEVPLYEPAGDGEHLYLRLEKRGITTDEAIRRVARRLGVPRAKVGHAGLKDAHAVTVQTISIHFAPQDSAARLEGDPQLRVLDAKRHRNKLKVGHLLGNRFRLVLRGAGPGEAQARVVLERLAARGVASFFGLQRFGRERTTHRLGEALVRGEHRRYLDLLLLGPEQLRDAAAPADDEPDEPEAEQAPDEAAAEGEAEPADDGPREGPAATSRAMARVAAARAKLRAGDPAGAARLLPRSAQAEQAALWALSQGRDPEAAVRAIPLRLRSFHVGAFQSFLFNAYLARRLDRIDRVEAGEVVTLHRNGASFTVEDVAAEQARCAAFELSPSGPSFGHKLLRPREGSSARSDEDEVLAALAPGLGPELTPAGGVKPQGERRALRTPLKEVEARREGDDLVVSFFLPKGCYATGVLEELFKRQVD